MQKGLDGDLHALLVEDPELGWKRFVDAYTPTILRYVEQAGIVERDEAMDVYVRVCEKLAEDDAARLRNRDPSQGSLSSWLVVVVRHAVVDWIRSRAGRRRLFRAVRGLDRFDRRVFELYYWEGLAPGEIVETVSAGAGAGAGEQVSLLDVLGALDRIEETLSQRQRSELLSLAVRSRRPVSLDDELEYGRALTDEGTDADPSDVLQAKELAAGLNAALSRLDPEDAAILRLRYMEGLSLRDIEKALHLPSLERSRVRRIVSRLRTALSVEGAGASEGAVGRVSLVEEETG